MEDFDLARPQQGDSVPSQGRRASSPGITAVGWKT